MATFIKTLENNGDTILPRTVARAVIMEDGTSLEAAIANRSTEHVKLTAEVAAAYGLTEGSELSDLLIQQSRTANVLATAEVIT